MQEITHKDLLNAGVHFGHLKKKWNPKMSPYIFMERKGIHVIDLYKTSEMLQEAAQALRSIARSGKKIMYVATKKQAQEIAGEAARSVNMPYITDRWLGGMLTNFATIRKSIKKMQSIDRMLNDGSLENVTKKEKLVMDRERQKLERMLGGISQLNRLPSAVFIVDTNHEDIALAEAIKLNITTFAMVDTNSDPTKVDFPIPANDDSTKSIQLVINYMTEAIQEGLEERKKEKEDREAEKKKQGKEAKQGEDEEAAESEEKTDKKESGKKQQKKGSGKRKRTKKVTSSAAGKTPEEKKAEEEGAITKPEGETSVEDEPKSDQQETKSQKEAQAEQNKESQESTSGEGEEQAKSDK